MERMKSAVKRSKPPIREFAGQCGFALMIAAMLTTALLGLFAAACVGIDVPFLVHGPVTTVLASVSVLAAAYLVGRHREKTGLALGACTGLAMFCFIALLSLILRDEPATGRIYVKLLALVCSGGIGGLAGVNKKTKKKKLRIK